MLTQGDQMNVLKAVIGKLRWRLSSRRKLLLELPKGSVGVEVGVHLGDFSSRILSEVNPAKLFLVDPWMIFDSAEYSNALYGGKAAGQAEMDDRHESVVRRFQSEIKTGVVEIHRGTFRDLVEQNVSGFDWVYIDGDHTYEAVKADLTLALATIKRPGLICGDDLQTDNWWGDDVESAVRKFCSRHQLQLTVIGNQFIIRV